MDSFLNRYKNAIVLVTVLLAQVVLLAMQVRRPAPGLPDGHNVRLWRYWVANLITPPERWAHDFGLGIRGVWANYIDLRNVKSQNEQLQDEITRLRLEQAGLAEDAREGQRLRALLDFQGHYVYKTVSAQVIGTSGTDQSRVLFIDKGFADGIRTQMPVITPDGIVGKIKEVFPHTAQVLEISDQTSGAGVMLQTTRIRGVLRGNSSGQPQIINISPDDRIKPGEPVVTSGGDQIYPRGLPVGTVESVVPDPETSYVNVRVKPDANLGRLEEVLVITETADKMPFSEEKDLLQSEVDGISENQRASDVLSEKLPTIDQSAVTTAQQALAGDSEDGGIARPVRPPSALHPDRYSPGDAPPASGMVPGEGPRPKENPPGSLARAVSPSSSSGGASSSGLAAARTAPAQSANASGGITARTNGSPIATNPANGIRATSLMPRTAAYGVSTPGSSGTAMATPHTAVFPGTASAANHPSATGAAVTHPPLAGTASQTANPNPTRPAPVIRATPAIPSSMGDNSILTPLGMGRVLEPSHRTTSVPGSTASGAAGSGSGGQSGNGVRPATGNPNTATHPPSSTKPATKPQGDQ